MKNIRVRIVLALTAMIGLAVYAQSGVDENSYAMGYKSMEGLIEMRDSGYSVSSPEGLLEFLAGMESVPAEFKDVDSTAIEMYSYGMMFSHGLNFEGGWLSETKVKAFCNGFLAQIDSISANGVSETAIKDVGRILDRIDKSDVNKMSDDSVNIVGRCFALVVSDPKQMGLLQGENVDLTETSWRMFLMGMRYGMLMNLGEKNIPARDCGRIAGYSLLCTNEMLRASGKPEVDYADMLSGTRAALGLESLRIPLTVIDSIYETIGNYEADTVEVVEIVDWEGADSLYSDTVAVY